MLSGGFSQNCYALCLARLRHHRNSTVRVALMTRATDHPYHPFAKREDTNDRRKNTNDNGTVATPKSAPHARAPVPNRNTQAVTALVNTGTKNGIGNSRVSSMAHC